MNTPTLLHPVLRLWNRLIEPDAGVTDLEARYRSRLLAGILLAITILVVLVLPPRYLVNPTPYSGWRLLGAAFGMVAVMFAYRLARRGHYDLAGKLVVVLASVIIFVSAALTPAEIQLGMLYYTMVLTLFASLFLSVRFTFVVAAGHILGMLLFPFFTPDIAFQQIIEGPAAFSLMLTFIALIFARSRRSIEKERQAQLAESETRYRMISELMSDYAYCLRVEPNGTFIREWSTGDFGSSPIADALESGASIALQDPEESGRFQLDLLSVLRGQQGASEYRVPSKEGEPRWLYITRRPVMNAKTGRAERIYGVVQDITERKQTETERMNMVLQRERLKLVGDFVEAVSHDFRTSLATIETNRYLLQETISGDSKTGRRLDHIHQAVAHLTEQLENLKSLSSLIALKAHPYSVNTLVEGVVARYQLTAEARGVTLTVRPQPDLPPVLMDVNEIERALRHLLINALAYTPAGGVITIETRISGQQVSIVVQDTGIGIEAGDVPRVFDFFYRADPARSTDSGGVGLGLSIVRMIAEAHSGSIRVSSTPGRGATFTLTLPAA